MFEIILCEDKIPIPYHHLITNSQTTEINVKPQILLDIITQKYNDRVFPKFGLLIDLYDIVKAYECKSIPDIPVAYARVCFRYIVFNPPIGSVWEGSIINCNEEGIQLTLSFFNEIWIPFPNLPSGSEFSSTDNVWVYFASEENEDNDNDKLFFDIGDTVRFRVCEVIFNSEESNKPLMQVIGLMNTTGLGPKRWWIESIE